MNRVTRITQFKLLKGIVAFCCLVSIAAAFQPPSAGLQGVLPELAPYDVSIDQFDIFPEDREDWSAWSESTALLVADLYEDTELDAAGQQELLNKLNERLAFMEKSLKDPAYRALWDEFTILYGRVSRRVDLAQAALDTLTLDPAAIQKQQREEAMAKLDSAVANLQSAMRRVGSAGEGWLTYFKAQELADLTVDSENAADVLNSAKSLFEGRESLSDEQKEFANRAEFDNVASAVNQTLEVWNMPPPENYDIEALRAELSEVIAAVESYEESHKAEAASQVRTYANSFGEHALDNGERVQAALQKHYLNPNVIITASESFLSKMASDPRTTSSPISEYVGNARVSGSSTTSYNSTVNLRPNPNVAELELQLNGTVRTNTVSVVPDARIGTGGNHTFNATQRLTFSGTRLALYDQPRIDVNVNNYTTSINTKADGTLFEGTGRRKAQQAIAARRGQTNSLTREKIINQVMPQFRSEVPQQVEELNKSLEEGLIAKLEEKELLPESIKTRTTDSELISASKILKEGYVAGDQPNVGPELNRGASLQVHESAVNIILDELNFAGRTMTETEVKTELEEQLSYWLGKDFKFPVEDVNAEGEPVEGDAEDADADEETVFIFDANDPVRVKFQGNKVHFTIRAGFKREGKDDLETQIITVPLNFTMKDEATILIEADTPEVRSESGANVAQSNAIKKRIMAAFPPRERSRQLEIEREGRSPIKLSILDLSALNGWLTLKIQ
ncbi:MAG: hypothetical protein CMJ46_07505 [Planctomyces sp.]|nr:hypothetical protein [Planctomyces sp.]